MKSLRFLGAVPKYGAKNDANNNCEEKPYSIVGWISPVGQVLLPETGLVLIPEVLVVFTGEIKFLGAWCCSA